MSISDLPTTVLRTRKLGVLIYLSVGGGGETVDGVAGLMSGTPVVAPVFIMDPVVELGGGVKDAGGATGLSGD